MKTSLTNEAAEVLRDTPMDPNAYEDAWNEVQKTFDDKREIIACHFSDIMNLNPIKETEIRQATTKISASIRGLKINGLNTEALSPMICYIVAGKLDKNLRKEWERSIKDNSRYPSFEQLNEFLKNVSHANNRVLGERSSQQKAEASKSLSSKPSEKSVPQRDKKTSFNVQSSSARSLNCACCGESHYLSYCSKFLEKNVFDRHSFVKEKQLCFNCLRPGHRTNECRSSKCKNCSKSHHTLLHREEKAEVSGSKESGLEGRGAANLPVAQNASAKPSYSGVIHTSRICLLPSAIVLVIVNEKPVKARALLDSCSEANLVTEGFVRRNRIPLLKSSSFIAGVTSDEVHSTHAATLVIKSRLNNFQFNMSADVIQRIPYRVDHTAIGKLATSFSGIDLADSSLDSSEVDIIIGVEFANLCLLGEKKMLDHLCLERSQFGWIVSGALNASSTPSVQYCNLITDVEYDLKRFWEIEEVEPSKPHQIEHDLIEHHFADNVKRLSNGQFSVSLPFKKDRSEVANTYRKALQALLYCEKKHKPSIWNLYSDFMKEYLELGHMERVPEAELIQPNCYYLPHHCVVRPSSLTTKLRVVFNASAKDASGCSLNEALRIGPAIQPDLSDLLLKFRRYPVAFTADISKMYRCILINPEDRDMQRILWRDNPSQPVLTYRLRTVTYGTAPASYLATKCLQMLANELHSRHPEEAEAIGSEFYMDDLMSGADTAERAIQKQRIIHETLSNAKFPLRKYASNSLEVLKAIDQQLVDKHRILNFDAENCVSILGLQWKPVKDEFSVNVKLKALPELATLTKRMMCSFTAKVFDPLGFISPVSITNKLFIQDLWKEEIQWDTIVPTSIAEKFSKHYTSLSQLESFSVPRPYSNSKSRYSLVGFSDASARAYSAVVYLRCKYSSNKFSSVLVCSKTRVAPVKSLTIPRLELLGALLLTKLLVRVSELLKIDTSDIFAFSDSTIVLAWIKGPSDKYETFVRNRSSYIGTRLPFSHWNYVQTTDNPADLCTRGISPQKFLQQRSFWVYGPKWLVTKFEEHVSTDVVIDLLSVPETRKSKKTLVAMNRASFDLLNKFSSYLKCVRVVAYAVKFINNIKRGRDKRASNRTRECLSESNTGSPLTASEMNEALNYLVRGSQAQFFQSEIELLSKKLPLPNRSPLLSISAFLDQSGILRVGGRLSNSEFSENVKHPIILHKKSRLLELYADYVHKFCAHAPRSFCVNFIQNRYWIVGGVVRLVKRTIFQCVRCARFKAETCKQIMGDLPAARTLISRPFTNTGVDLTGFFEVKCTNHRTVKVNKVYASFFVCFSTKAVHIELVTDLSTDAFLAALERFVSRRGLPQAIYSDNATNFIGANNLLNLDTKRISDFFANRSIRWSFIPARSPHQGGLWESAVKSGKSALKKTIGNQILTREELNTVLIKIEAILNSRPLCRSPDPGQLALSPAHFLVGEPLFEIPINESGVSKLRDRYQLVRQITASFWKVWSQSYLQQLQMRTKWKQLQPNLRVGDVVLLRCENTSSMKWPLGMVLKTFPDSKNVVRRVEVKCSNGTYCRAVQQLVKLPIDGA